MKIEGVFKNIKNANEALDDLKKAGFNNAFVDIYETYDENRNVNTNIVGLTNGYSLSELVLDSGNVDIPATKAPIAAANPDASGMSTGEDVLSGSYKIIVKSDLNLEKVKEIIKNKNGKVL